MNRLRDLREQLLDFFFPPRCCFCGAVMPRTGEGICGNCAKILPFVENRKILRKIGKYTCAVTFYYEGVVKRAILALKFQGCFHRADRLAAYLARTIAHHLEGEFDTVTYVPIHPLRRLRRGYDQSRLLAEAVGRLLGIKAVKTIGKIRNNPPQSLVKGPGARARNVQGAYRVVRPMSVVGRRILLIDDVVTSGATLTACADELLAAGAASVVCAALTGGHQSDPLPSLDDFRALLAAREKKLP